MRNERTTVNVPCVQCGALFPRPSWSKQTHCSGTCASVSYSARKVLTPCYVCGTRVYRIPKRVTAQRFTCCSLACARQAKAGDIEYRFWAKVDRNGPIPEHVPALGNCWLWTGAKWPDGYGCFMIRRRKVRATHVAYELTHKAPVPGPMMLHRCDNPPCVRPDHLFSGDARDNALDAIAKGRFARDFKRTIRRGDEHHQARLVEADIPEIRRRIAAGESTRAVGSDYGVSGGTISLAARRLTWAHVP